MAFPRIPRWMKKLADTACWIFAAGAAGSLALAAFVFSRIWRDLGLLPGPEIGPFNAVSLSMATMAVSLLFGLMFALPIMRQRQKEQEQLTDRAAELEHLLVVCG